MPGIPATQKAEIRRILVQSQPRQIVPRDPVLKNPSKKKKAGEGAQDENPEFKPQYHTQKNTLNTCMERKYHQ
jgi:hypothetical protein